MDIVSRIITNIIESLYRYSGTAIVVAVLFMFAYGKVQELGFKSTVRYWKEHFITSVRFRQVFLLAIYVSLILLRTVFCRSIWGNPISNVLGNWSLQYSDGSVNTEEIENILLFIPYSILLLKLSTLQGDVNRRVVWLAIKASFWLSVGIECCQIVFRVGTFQLSDLFFNTLGGFIGGSLYYGIEFLKYRSRKR